MSAVAAALGVSRPHLSSRQRTARVVEVARLCLMLGLSPRSRRSSPICPPTAIDGFMPSCVAKPSGRAGPRRT